jgi:hypothetical protein
MTAKAIQRRDSRGWWDLKRMADLLIATDSIVRLFARFAKG